MMFRWPLVALTLVSFALPGLAQTVQPRPDLKILRFDPQAEVNISLARILENLNHSQISRGAVIASPSQRDPDYFFHWVRDAGLTMGALIDFAHRHPRVPQAIQQWSLHERALQNISSQAPGGWDLSSTSLISVYRRGRGPRALRLDGHHRPIAPGRGPSIGRTNLSHGHSPAISRNPQPLSSQ